MDTDKLAVCTGALLSRTHAVKLMDRELASLSVMPRDWRDSWFRTGGRACLHSQ
jgi:hypothetical protein